MKKIIWFLWLLLLTLCVYFILNIPVYITANYPFFYSFLFATISNILLVIVVWNITTIEKMKNFKIILNANPKCNSWILYPLFLFSWLVWPFMIYLNFNKDKTVELEQYGLKSNGKICKTWRIPGKNGGSEHCKVSHKVIEETFYFNDHPIRTGMDKRIVYEVNIIYSKRYPFVGKIDRKK